MAEILIQGTCFKHVDIEKPDYGVKPEVLIHDLLIALYILISLVHQKKQNYNIYLIAFQFSLYRFIVNNNLVKG